MPIRDRLSHVMTRIYEQTMEMTHNYVRKTRQQVYITPVMFMSVFKIFQNLLSRKNEEID